MIVQFEKQVLFWCVCPLKKKKTKAVLTHFFFRCDMRAMMFQDAELRVSSAALRLMGPWDHLHDELHSEWRPSRRTRYKPFLLAQLKEIYDTKLVMRLLILEDGEELCGQQEELCSLCSLDKFPLRASCQIN